MAAVPIQVEGFAYGGEAFGRLPDGKVCFFRGGVPGETARVEVTVSKRSFARGVLAGVEECCDARIEPHCPLAVRPGGAIFCPGCSYQQVSYPEELRWKQRQLTDFMLRGRLADESSLQPPVAAPERFHWRNRLKLSGDGGSVGFYAEDNRTLVSVKHCPLAVRGIDDVLPEHRCELRDGAVKLRWTAADGLVVNGGGRELTEALDGFGCFRVPAESFFQTNLAVASLLVHGVVDILKEISPRTLLELYCGVGVFSLAAADGMTYLHVDGVEIDAAAIAYAGLNARLRGVSARCHYISCRAERVRMGKQRPEVLLLDPPRRGLAPELTGRLKEWRVPYILYVSCAPDTLARDLHCLKGTYRVERCRMYDMFPSTGHFETLTLLRLE